MGLFGQLQCSMVGVFNADAQRECIEGQLARQELRNENRSDRRDHNTARQAQGTGFWAGWDWPTFIDGVNTFHGSSNMSANSFFGSFFGGGGGAPPGSVPLEDTGLAVVDDGWGWVAAGFGVLIAAGAGLYALTR